MNTHLITLGLGGALLITLGLAAGVVGGDLALACIDDAAPTAVVSDEVPCA